MNPTFWKHMLLYLLTEKYVYSTWFMTSQSKITSIIWHFQNLIIEAIRYGLLHGCFFLEFFENFQNSYVKGQSCFHAVGTLEETDGLLKDLIKSALSLVINNICKFKTFWFFQRCLISSSGTKKTFKIVLLYYQSIQPACYNVGWHFFHNLYKAVKWPFSFTVSKNATEMCVLVCERFHLCSW